MVGGRERVVPVNGVWLQSRDKLEEMAEREWREGGGRKREDKKSEERERESRVLEEAASCALLNNCCCWLTFWYEQKF